MKNLEIVNLRHCDLKQLGAARILCVDSSSKKVYFESDHAIHCLDFESGKCCSVISDAALNSDDVVASQFLFENQSLCVAFGCGDIVTYDTLTAELEHVGAIDNGLQSMCWSPDQELVVFLSCGGKLILMTREFDVLQECVLHSDDAGKCEFVTVGWGKKETQFHGSEGKEAAKIKAQKADGLFKLDDKKSRISWRGDGQYFAINTVSPNENQRRIKIYNREGVLQHVSEEVAGLEQCFAWKPQGSVMASTHRKANKHEVIFFEKNGLRHGEFTLPFTVEEANVLEIAWNVDSKILCVFSESLDGLRSHLQFWSVGNYHWYLKNSFDFDAEISGKVISFQWDSEVINRIHLFTDRGVYLQYNWKWTVHCSINRSVQDHALVTVIDGRKLLVTCFRKVVIPPPMAQIEFKFDHPVNHVVHSVHTPNTFLVVLSNGDFVLFNEDQLLPTGGKKLKVRWELGESVAGIHSLPYSCFQWAFISRKAVGCVRRCLNESVVCIGDFDEHTLDLVFKSYRSSAPESCLTTAFIPSRIESRYHLQSDSGEIRSYRYAVGEVQPIIGGSFSKFSSSCLRLDTFTSQTNPDLEVIVGLTEHGKLYANNIEISTKCTSFSIHDDFLVLTTNSHVLECWPLIGLLEVGSIDGASFIPVSEEGNARPLERGSQIVISVSFDTRVVLQMPRGNIETIHPRSLTLAVLSNHLKSLNFKSAFLLARRHRINMNVLVDYSPEVFLQNLELFIDQIEDSQWLSQFVSDLLPEDTIKTMYHKFFVRSKREVVVSTLCNADKVNGVCDRLREVLERTNPEKYFVPILTCLVRRIPCGIDLALLRIKEKSDGAGDCDKEALKRIISGAIKYLLYLVNVDTLYKVALGTYDFDLVKMVAEESQKDPKEYLHFLGELSKLDEPYRKFSIDRHLQRFELALTHLVNCDDRFDECVQFVKTHKLYKKALELYTAAGHKDKLNLMYADYGQYLHDTKRYSEATVVFMRCGNWEQSLVSAQKSHQWKYAVCAATKLDYTPESMTVLAKSFSKTLMEANKFLDAAAIIQQYTFDYRGGIRILIEGHEWDEAYRLIHMYGEQDLLSSQFVPALLSYQATLVSSIENSIFAFNKYKERLEVVRAMRLEASKLNEDCEFDDKGCDLYSDTSSTVASTTASSRPSNATGRTNRTSRNRRKDERKKYRLKEGSTYEHLALQHALSEIITKADSLKDDVDNLVRILFVTANEGKAKVIQTLTAELHSVIDANMDVIWPKHTSNHGGSNGGPIIPTGPESTSNQIAKYVQVSNSSAVFDEGDDCVPAPVRKSWGKWEIDLS